MKSAASDGDGKTRVILIEDDHLLRGAINEWLTRQGMDVLVFDRAAAIGPSGMKCLCSNGGSCADILISDVRLPDSNGIEMLAELRRRGCKIPHVALMSGWWTQDREQAAVSMGAHIFHKPGDFSALLKWARDISSSVKPDRRIEDHFRRGHVVPQADRAN
jgi:DNA-binding response OmpR family regulator